MHTPLTSFIYPGVNPHPCLSHKAAQYRRGREVIQTSKSPQHWPRELSKHIITADGCLYNPSRVTNPEIESKYVVYAILLVDFPSF